MSKSSSWHHLEGCRVLARTDRAVKVLCPANGEKWIPRSVLYFGQLDELLTITGMSRTVTVLVAEWWAEKEGLV